MINSVRRCAKKAFILGNGPSRPTDIKWLNNLEGDTYGCNALYRDFEPDFLVATDPPMMREIASSSYSGNCEFTDYEVLPMDALDGIRYMPKYETTIYIGEQEDASGFIFMGNDASNQYYIIWLDESLRHITWGFKPQFGNPSTGLCALQLALENGKYDLHMDLGSGYDEIDMIGFDGVKGGNYKNIYDGTKNYTFDPIAPDKVRVPETYVPINAVFWYKVYTKLVKQYPNTKVNLR